MALLVKVVLLVAVPGFHADVQTIPYPPLLEKLYKSFGKSDASNRIGESIGCYSISTFAFKNNQVINPYVPPDAAREYVQRVSQNPAKRRQKRGTFLPPGQYRLRKEYRMMSTTERNVFQTCLQELKERYIGDMSIYDTIAAIHKEDIDVHNGVNFLPWHRVYLWTLENALRDLGGNCSQVTLPYWDCTAEYYANTLVPNSAAQSIIFSERFAGLGNGAVTDGPFRNWNLSRQVSESWELFGRDTIEWLKTIGTNDLITSPGTYYSIEFYHNMIHRFVGGYLSSITNAPRDPLFFMLHCFVDAIWEEIRQAMILRGLDPTVYPNVTNEGHKGPQPMDVFTGWTNEEGFSNLWYERHVRYQPSFSCRPEGGDTCKNTEGVECIWNEYSMQQECTAFRESATESSEPQTVTTTPHPPTTTLPWWFWFWKKRKRRAATSHNINDYGSSHTTIAEKDKVHVCDSHTCPSAPTSMQNTYTINGVTDSALWVYLPVKVIFIRPPGLKFHTFPCYSDGKVAAFNFTQDIFDPAFNVDLKRHLHTGKGRPYDYCRINDAGSAKIYIRSDGINYDGNSMEYASLDERYPISSQKAFIAIKDPTFNVTEVCLMAYDSCGRLCLPTCRRKGSAVYQPCTGCIRVNNKHPKMYGRTVADIVADQWTFNSIDDYEFLDPTESAENIYLKFVCDASSKFPWQRQKPGVY
ncbi:uncharacterized protein LOC132547864 [Ylistrum balloti]|uniref:uncharacterized protein LOC132547864 n=1 Tax=Ylistrum balloti TaxID=509963 RepID=UPI002905A139|nr:uncharacterized protein LOC132547864 [Ylistrum balloti]